MIFNDYSGCFQIPWFFHAWNFFWWFSRFSMISRACGNPVTLNCPSHIWHWNYGFKRHLFMCVTKWALRLLLTLNLRSQIWHWNGRAPVCILSWLSKSLRRAKAFPQKAQLCRFCASCCSWVFNIKNSLKPEILNKRIYHECEGRIKKICPEDRRLASQGLPSDDKGDPGGRIFLSYPHTNNGFFSLLTTVFLSENKLQQEVPECNFTRWRHFNITMTSLPIQPMYLALMWQAGLDSRGSGWGIMISE